jgi:hypothetical protein
MFIAAEPVYVAILPGVRRATSANPLPATDLIDRNMKAVSSLAQSRPGESLKTA